MKKLVDELQIQPRKNYGIMEISKLKLIPWATNYRTLVKILRDGDMGWDTTQTTLTQGIEQQRYCVKGNAIKKYIINYGPALLGTVRKTNNEHRTKKTRSRGKGASRTNSKTH